MRTNTKSNRIDERPKKKSESRVTFSLILHLLCETNSVNLMQTLLLPLQNLRTGRKNRSAGAKPFYLQHLESYLGMGYNPEMHEHVMDEIVDAVENRMKMQFCK